MVDTGEEHHGPQCKYAQLINTSDPSLCVGAIHLTRVEPAGSKLQIATKSEDGEKIG